MTIASDDFYSYSARQRLQQINANRAQALADLEVAKANADYNAAGFAVQQVADLEAQRQALVSWLSGLPAIAEYFSSPQDPPGLR